MIRLFQQDPHDGSLRDLAPDLTPMLDILFILLVFFMLTAGVVFQSLNLKLPETASDDIPMLDAPMHIMVEVRKGGYAIDGKKQADFTALKQSIVAAIKESPKSELVIAGDKEASIEKLLSLLTYLQSEGIEAANILMKQERN